MAVENVDEDAPLSSLHSNNNADDNDPTDDLPDFRFLAALTTNSKGQIPKRGEKDFEPHGTRHQDAILDASRQAMHDALDYTRVHVPKSQHRAWYFGDGVADENEEQTGGIMSEAIRGRGLDRDHVVLVEAPSGTHFRTMGKAALGLKQARVWMLPEEALYLIERGNLDLWWPSRPLCAIKGHVSKQGPETVDEESEEDDGVPLSLQAAYALLIGEDTEKGKVSLERYTVFANLKRTGYVVLRSQPHHEQRQDQNLTMTERVSRQATHLFALLFGEFFNGKPTTNLPYGPLVKPGLYRSYNYIYQQLFVIRRHVPTQYLDYSLPSPEDPFRVAFDVWKPTRIPTFAKTDPGNPDFRIAVISSRSTETPTITQLTSLLESTPWDPPNTEWKGPSKRYQRLKHGWRNVVLAVVDQGIISYLRVGETAFGEEKLHEGFDRGGFRGGKRGGYRGRGGRAGRGGRGRGR